MLRAAPVDLALLPNGMSMPSRDSHPRDNLLDPQEQSPLCRQPFCAVASRVPLQRKVCNLGSLSRVARGLGTSYFPTCFASGVVLWLCLSSHPHFSLLTLATVIFRTKKGVNSYKISRVFPTASFFYWGIYAALTGRFSTSFILTTDLIS